MAISNISVGDVETISKLNQVIARANEVESARGSEGSLSARLTALAGALTAVSDARTVTTNEVVAARSGSASLADRLGVILDAALDQSDAVLTYLGGVIGAQATASQQRDTALGQRIDAVLLAMATDAEVAAAISAALAPYATDAELASAVSAIQTAVSDAVTKADTALASSNSLIGQAFTRPGDARALFSSALTGSALSRPAIAAGIVVPSSDLGSVLRIRGVDTDDVTGYVDVARRIDFAIEPSRTYLVTATVDRNVDPSDPANNAVEIRWQNLNANKANVSNVRLGGVLLPTVAGGPLRVSFLIGKAGAPGTLAYTVPPSAVYGLPLVRVYGNGAETDVASIDVRDVTDDISGGTELVEIINRIAQEEAARQQLAEEVQSLASAVDKRIRYDELQTLSLQEKAQAKVNLDLGEVDNTRDIDKLVSIPQMEELDGRIKAISGDDILQIADENGFVGLEVTSGGAIRGRDVDFDTENGNVRVVDEAGFVGFEVSETGVARANAVEIGSSTIEHDSSTPAFTLIDESGFIFFEIDGSGSLQTEAVEIGTSLLQSDNSIPFVTVIDQAGFIGFELGAEVDEREFGPVDTDFLIPDDLWLTAGRPIPLHAANASLLRSPADSVDASIISTGIHASLPYLPSGKRFEIDPDRIGSSTVLSLRRIQETAGVSYRKTVGAHVAAATSSASPVLLMITDSLGNRVVPTLLKAKLAARGMTPTFVGTIPSFDGTSELTGPLGEFREGREYGDYIGMQIDDMAPVAIGAEAAYLASFKTTKVFSNPFLRPSAGGDPSDRVFNGFIFDLHAFLERFSIATPTHIIVPLGTNDVTYRSEQTAKTQIRNGMRVMHAQIRAALPNVQLAFMQHTIGRDGVADARWPMHHWMIKEHIRFVRSLGDPKTKFIGAYLHQDFDAGFPAAGVSDVDTGLTPSTINDVIHFSYQTQSITAELLASWVGATV